MAGKFFCRLVMAATVFLTILTWQTIVVQAEVSITARAALHEGFGRIVFDWPDKPIYQTSRDGHSILVTFREPFEVSFDSVKRVLGSYLSNIELHSNGRTIAIELIELLEYRAFTYGDKVIIDLMDPVSGIAGKAEDGETVSPTNQTTTTALVSPQEQVAVRIGNHPNFSRLVFDWPGVVDYQVTTVGNETVIRFNRSARIDLSKFNASPPKHILSAKVETKDKYTLVTLVTDPATRIRHFRANLRIVIDALVTPAGDTQSTQAAPPEKSEPQETAAIETPADKPEIKETPKRDSADQVPTTNNTITTAEETVSDQEVETEISDADKESQEQTADAPIELASVTTPTLPSAQDTSATEPPPEPVAESPIAPSADQPDLEAETVADQPAPAVTTAQLSLGPPSMTVTVKNETNRTLITFAGGKRVSSAVFIHGGHLWVIFEEPFIIDLAAARATKKTAYSMVEQRNHDKATVLRFKLRKGFGATMRRRGTEWFLQITPSPESPESIDIRVTGDPTTNQRVKLSLTQIGNRIQIRDPADRATIDVIPIMASGQGMVKLHRYAQFDLLATLQGIAISGPSQIQVFTSLAGLEISTRAGPISAPVGPETAKQRARPVTTLFEFAAWRRGDERSFINNRAELHRAVATASKRDLGNARFDLARFLFAHGFMAEAFGVLSLLVEQEPRRGENISLRAMRGVMNLAMLRISEAVGDLSATVFDGYDDVALWRGVLAMKQGDLNGAAAFFLQAGDLWLELPLPLRDNVGLMAAEAVLANHDLAKAKAHLDILRSTSKNYDIQQRVKHLTGRLLLASGDREAAVNVWRQVIAGSDRLARARAIFDDTLMMLEDDQITLKEATTEIEGLRYSWRSDEFELQVLQQLAAFYIRDGQYRMGLSTMKRAVTHFSKFRATAAIATRMNDLFSEIFLDNGAEDLPAIDATALYFEFQELTPVGAKGDQVIQRLADRLVALDLLGRAAELLDHQLRYRLKGVEMARVGTRLAVLHLMNGTPESAIRALRRSRLKRMPKDLLIQRRHIRVRALADLGREEDAVKRLVGDDSSDAELLRADVYWRAGKWVKVAEATERLLELTTLKRPLSSFASRHLLRLAVALALSDDQLGLSRINRLYTAVMRGDTNQQAFDVITADTGSREASFRELPNAVARIASFEAFMSTYRERVKNGSLSAIN